MLALPLAALLACAAPAAARNVDTGDLVPLVREGGLFRLGYANDYFSATDRYYTQGIALDGFHPALAKWPPMRVLPVLPGGTRAYGLSARDSTFTPSRVDDDGPIVGDRPFAAYAYVGHVAVSRDAARGLTLTAELDAGMIGQAVGGTTQKWAHRVLKDRDPRGWQNQVRDDVVLDGYLRLEKTVQSSAWEELIAGLDATAGTLYDNASAEATMRVGRLGPGTGSRAFAFARVSGKAVGYDATLQGGVTNRHSPYVLRAAAIDRWVAREDLGAAVDFRGLAFQAVWTDLGPEFRGGLSQRWMEFTAARRF